MKTSLKKIEFISLIAASVFGCLFHFFYGWSGENPAAGLFFPVNESTWEHLKLIFFPILLLAIWEYLILNKSYTNFICIKFVSTLIGICLTVILFYTYTGIYGKNSEFMNILLYFISLFAAYYASYVMLRRKMLSGVSCRFCYFGFLVMTLLFFVFTVFPPPIGLFAPPV